MNIPLITSYSSSEFADFAPTGWCELAYWELNERVGSRVPVEMSAVDVFSDQTRGAGLCIKNLVQQRSTKTPDAVLKTREKMGLGEFELLIALLLQQLT